MLLEESPIDALLWAFRLRNRRISHGCVVACGERKGGDGSRADVANSFIAKVYFKQATDFSTMASMSRRRILPGSAALWPDHPGALNNLGTAVWRQGRHRGGEEYHRRALDLAPNDYAILNNLGNVLWEQRRL